MASTPFFSNQPLFCTKPTTIPELMGIDQFNALTAYNLSCTAMANNCLDPNLGTTFIKNVVHKVIRCGGRPIDINFFTNMWPETAAGVETSKRIFNHYICDPDLNIYAAASVTGTGPAQPTWFQVLKQNHSSSGTTVNLAKGYILIDKDNQISYQVTNVDTTIPYAYKYELTPTDENVTVSIKANVAYLVLPTRLVGGYSCPDINNKASTIGYSQEIRPLRVRSDWSVEFNLLRGYTDKIQYAVIYDYNGMPYDAWDVYEADQARLSVRIAINVLSFIGTPTTNQSLITGPGATIDSEHTGYYGLVPMIANGGGVVQNYNSSVGFDMESDGEPIFLYQDSLKRSYKFLMLCGQQFLFGLDDRSNKMVTRTQGNANMFEAYRRLGESLTPVDKGAGQSWETELRKLAIKSYDYRGFLLDFKKWDALSDARYIGSDYYSNLVVGIPMEGVTEAGREINPIEFYQYGMNGQTGGYEEFKVDNRQVTLCESMSGFCAQSEMMAVHCPQLFILLKPASAA